MKTGRIVNSVFNSNTFIIHGLADASRAVIVDIGDFRPLADYLERHGLQPEALLLTHTHYDHIYGLPEFMAAFPEVEIYTSEFGKEALANPKWNFSRYHDNIISITDKKIVPLRNSSAFTLPGITDAACFATPGHDRSCMSYRLGKALFSGDSYIPGVKVIATFPNSDREEADMWYHKLEAMGASLDVYPGHGDPKLLNRDYHER